MIVDNTARLGVYPTASLYPMLRRATAERLALSGMVAGAHIYDTDLNSVFYWNGAAWILAY